MNARAILLLTALFCGAADISAQVDAKPSCPPAEKGSLWIRVSPPVIKGMVLNKVLPSTAHLEAVKSDVRLKIEFDKSGTVTCVVALEGHPLLIPRGIEAARQWTFRPFTVNGTAVNVQSGLVFRFNKGKVSAIFP